jgi:uncharacterized protein YtpQ (UPF0354 family)
MRELLATILMIGMMNWNGLFGQNEKSSKKSIELEWNAVKDKIYPMLKQTVPFTDTTKVINLKENEKPITDTYLADIHIVYLIEFDNFFTYVNNGQLKKWNVSQDSLRKIALINLDNLANGGAQFHGDSTYAMIILNGNVEASLMLSDNFWPHISEIVNSKDLIIGIPTRDVLLVTNIGSKEGLEKLRKGVKKTFEQGDHVITKWIFKREKDKWTKFEYVE